MIDDNPFKKLKDTSLPMSDLADALGVSRNTLYRWSLVTLEGMPRIVLMALSEGKITFQDIARYRTILVTLKRVMSGDVPSGEEPIAALAAGRALPEGGWYDSNGVPRDGKTGTELLGYPRK